MLYVAIILLHLTGPGGQMIEVNPDEIVTLRSPRSQEHFAPGTRCLINTVDGKVVAVQEDCYRVKQEAEK